MSDPLEPARCPRCLSTERECMLPPCSFLGPPHDWHTASCWYCQIGFPKKNGIHYASQRLGMIPNHPCEDEPDGAVVDAPAPQFTQAELKEHAIQLGAIGMAGIDRPLWETRNTLELYMLEHFSPKRAEGL